VVIPCSPVDSSSVSERLSKRLVSPPIRLVGTSISSEKRKLRPLLFDRSLLGAAPYVTEISHPRNRPQATALINTCWFSTSCRPLPTDFPALRLKKGSFSFDPFRSRIDHRRVDLFRNPEPQWRLGLASPLRKSSSLTVRPLRRDRLT
jgi:hypothetical protein